MSGFSLRIDVDPSGAISVVVNGGTPSYVQDRPSDDGPLTETEQDILDVMKAAGKEQSRRNIERTLKRLVDDGAVIAPGPGKRGGYRLREPRATP